MNGETTQTSVFAGTSASPSTFTDLPTLQTRDDADDFLQNGANCDRTEHTSQRADSFYIPGYHRLHAWNQGQVRRLWFSYLSTYWSMTDVLLQGINL